jgi:hypothetical protein
MVSVTSISLGEIRSVPQPAQPDYQGLLSRNSAEIEKSMGATFDKRWRK